jgi:uncharacterized protein (DUF4415 family)
MSKPKPVEMDAETAAFAESVRLSLMQAKQGQAARTYTPEELQTIKAKRGRPTGSKQATVKVPTTLRLDEAALARQRLAIKGRPCAGATRAGLKSVSTISKRPTVRIPSMQEDKANHHAHCKQA